MKDEPEVDGVARRAILVVEDDAETRTFVAALLGETGADVFAVATLGEARAARTGRAWDLLVVDRMLPDGSGLDWVGEVRATGDPAPVLVLTALSDVGERVAGLERGADDYLGKPFAPLELKARARALLRRGGRSLRRLERGRVRVDADRREAFVDGVELPLTEREFQVVERLVAADGVRRDELLESVWGEATPESGASLDVILSRVRKKLAERGLAGAIETVRGFGLRWRAGEER